MTKLIIILDGIQSLPKNISFSIRDEKTGKDIIKSVNLNLQDRQYIWSGLIELGNYSVSAILPNTSIPLETKFTNTKLLAQFLRDSSSRTMIRNGDKNSETEKPQSAKKLQQISVGPFATTAEKIHLLLIDQNKLFAQYLGVPISIWTPDVPEASYNLVEIEYGANVPCKVKSKKL